LHSFSYFSGGALSPHLLQIFVQWNIYSKISIVLSRPIRSW
jgi:hypothetical protein